jgi:hypothetical protein
VFANRRQPNALYEKIKDATKAAERLARIVLGLQVLIERRLDKALAERASTLGIEVEAVLLPPCLAFHRNVMDLISMEVGQHAPPQRVGLLMGGETPFDCGEAEDLLPISSRYMNRREGSDQGSE